MKRIAVYPGTFDPVTLGHLDIIKRISPLYDKIYVAVAHSKGKKPFFSVNERVNMLKDCVKEYKNIEVEDFNSLVVQYAKSKGANVMIRGIRMISDFDYEFQMALTNRKLDANIETIFLSPNEIYSYVSSRLIKEAIGMGADISNFVPQNVIKMMRRKTGDQKGDVCQK